MPKKAVFSADIRRTCELSYLLYLPEGYHVDPAVVWPLIVFLHGAGERGEDLDRVRGVGLPPVIEAWPDCPFIVLAPQVPTGSDWLFVLDGVEALVDHIIADNRVDPARVYLTGMSMGGCGAWTLAARRPERFAALAPVCGRRPSALYSPEDAPGLKSLPTWIFHGTADDVIPVSESEFMLAWLEEGGAEVRATFYEGVGHDAWTGAYAQDELYAWFLGKRTR